MNYKWHLLVGFVVNIPLIFYNIANNSPIFLQLIISISLFSILPDIDHKNSTATKIFYLFLATTFLLSLNNFVNVFIITCLFFIHQIYARNDYKHRRFPHTFTFGIVSTIILYLLTKSAIICLAGFLAFASHIITDGHLDKAFRNDKKFWRRIL